MVCFPTSNRVIIDLYGNSHKIKIFKEDEALKDYLIARKYDNVFFDIDLDFFVEENPYSPGGGNVFTYMTDRKIEEILSIKNPLINWIFEKLAGFTIATEPKHCGGLLKSNELLDKVNNIYFEPSLFTPMIGSDWKHKNNSNEK